MDSFGVLFREDHEADEVLVAIRATGASAWRGEGGTIVASRQAAHVWVDAYSVADLPSREEWPIPKRDVKGIISITVRRNEESSYLAIEIAHQFASKLGGVISWDGNEYWSRLYSTQYQQDSSS